MFFGLLKASVIVYLGFGLYLYLAQRSFMYFPTAERTASGARVEYVQNQGEKIKLWVVGPESDRAVIYFGGNAEDVYANAADFRDTCRSAPSIWSITVAMAAAAVRRPRPACLPTP